jgi:hypothetical protein
VLLKSSRLILELIVPDFIIFTLFHGVLDVSKPYETSWLVTGIALPFFILWNLLFSMSSRLALGSTQPPFQCVPGGALSLAVKRQGREADHSPPASAEAKKMWIYTSTPPYAFMAWCLIS